MKTGHEADAPAPGFADAAFAQSEAVRPGVDIHWPSVLVEVPDAPHPSAGGIDPTLPRAA